MDELSAVLDQVIAEPPREIPPAERSERVLELHRLFGLYGDRDERRLAIYVEETSPIPLTLLVVAIRGVLRSNAWPRMPTIGDLWRASRYVAGMHREQFDASRCRYVRPPTEWPPEGQRHAITVGELEPVSAVPLLAPGELDRHRLLGETS